MFDRIHTLAATTKSTETYSRIANCFASTIDPLHSNANSTHAIHRIFACTLVPNSYLLRDISFIRYLAPCVCFTLMGSPVRDDAFEKEPNTERFLSHRSLAQSMFVLYFSICLQKSIRFTPYTVYAAAATAATTAQEGTMYLLWSRGSEALNFPMDYDVNGTTTTAASYRPKREAHSSHPHLHSPHRIGINDGLVMAQLLRADKLVIPER